MLKDLNNKSQTTKVLVCADSFGVPDAEFPGLHWIEKMLNFSPDIEVYNMSYGGCSNALIVLQLLQGLRLKPDFVVLSFTNENRYEIDKDINAMPTYFTAPELRDYCHRRYTTNRRTLIDNIDPLTLKLLESWMIGASSENFEKLKNYFFICFCLMTLKTQNIPFCFSLGGFEYKQDYNALINSNYLQNFLIDYADNELKTNLWFYQNNKTIPGFHVDNDQVLTLFANECIEFIRNKVINSKMTELNWINNA